MLWHCINQEEIESFLLPVTTQNHPLFNPDMDYSVYLTQPFFFVFLQVILLLVTTYSIGSEGKFHTSANWLGSGRWEYLGGGHCQVTSIQFYLHRYEYSGKLYVFLVPCIYRWIVVLGVESYFWLLVIATQALAVFLFSFPALSIIISIVSMVGSLGATLLWGYLSGAPHVCTGVLCLLSFPRPSLCRDWTESALWQLWLCVYVGQCSLSAVVSYSPLLLLPHLKRSLISRKYDDIE